jgi:glutathione peroxidase
VWLYPQYAGLQALYEQYKDKGFTVGVSCDQFGHQEPGDEQGDSTLCASTYQVTFPLFAKLNVNGPPRTAFPTSQSRGRARVGHAIKWNFTKFLVGSDGAVLRRLRRRTPRSIGRELSPLLP